MANARSLVDVANREYQRGRAEERAAKQSRIADMHEAAVRGERERIAAHLRAEIAKIEARLDEDGRITLESLRLIAGGERAALVETLAWIESQPS